MITLSINFKQCSALNVILSQISLTNKNITSENLSKPKIRYHNLVNRNALRFEGILRHSKFLKDL